MALRLTWLNLTVRPEPVEGWAVKPFMLRQAQHERLKLTVLGLMVKHTNTSLKPSINSDCGLHASEPSFQFRLLPSMNGGKNHSSKKTVVFLVIKNFMSTNSVFAFRSGLSYRHNWRDHV
jgi:hypothetical protein